MLYRLEGMLDELYGDEEIDETKMNDLLWFDSESVYEYIGLKSLSMIENELQDREEELNDLKYDIQADIEDLELKEEKLEIFEKEYKEDFLDILEEIKELKEEWEEF